MKPTRKTQPMRKGGPRLQTRSLGAALTGGNLTGGARAPGPNTAPPKARINRPGAPRRTGGLGAKITGGKTGGLARGLQPKLEVNRTGNERDGEKFRRVFNAKGEEIHVYQDGRRIKDKSPGDSTRKLFKK